VGHLPTEDWAASRNPSPGKVDPGPVALLELPRRRLFIFGGLFRLMAISLLCIATVALLAGALMEFALSPGVGWLARPFDTSTHFGKVELAELTGDDGLDRLLNSEPRSSEPPSLKIVSTTPTQARPNRQLYLAGKVMLGGVVTARATDGSRWIAALSTSGDSTTILLNLFRADSTGESKPFWQGVLFSPAHHPHSWRDVPRLTSMRFHQSEGRGCALLSVGAAFQGWRGVVRLELTSGAVTVERHPCGLEIHFPPGPSLVDEEGRSWLALSSFAPHNGNDLGGINDTCAALLLFSPHDGRFRVIDTGDKHNSLQVQVLPDQRHLVFHSRQEIKLPDGRRGHAFLLDSWAERVLRTWWIPTLKALWLAGDDREDRSASPALHGLAGTRVVALAAADSARTLWEWPPEWALPSYRDGWLVGDEGAGTSRVISLDGRQRVVVRYAGSGHLRMESRGSSLDDALAHVVQGSSITSYTLHAVPVWSRLLRSPATRLSAEVAAFFFLLLLVLRLRRQDNLLRGILDDNSQPVGLLDPQGRLTFANQELRRLLTDPQQGPALSTLAKRLRPGTGELHQSGERWMRWLLRPVRPGRQEVGSVIFGIDETALVAAEDGRRYRSLTGLITHELKTPIAPIGLGLDQLQREVERALQPMPEGLQRIIGRMRAELDRLRQLIRHFTAISGERRHRERVDLVAALAAGARRAELAGMPGIQCSWHLPDKAEVVGDAETLALVFGSLFNNAVEAMEHRGRLMIGLVPASDMATSGWTIFIEDTGRGVPAEIRHRIWEPGFSSRRGGYGYGLYFARHLLQDLGGQISLDPSAAGGTLVRIDLPQAPAGLEPSDKLEDV
jgi:signal transduction histidine kinase